MTNAMRGVMESTVGTEYIVPRSSGVAANVLFTADGVLYV